MGGRVSTIPPTPPNFPYFCLTIGTLDRLYLLHADQKVIGLVRSAIQQEWPGGVQSDNFEAGSMEIKFRGFPFQRNSAEDAMAIKKVFCKILMDLRAIGWRLAF